MGPRDRYPACRCLCRRRSWQRLSGVRRPGSDPGCCAFSSGGRRGAVDDGAGRTLRRNWLSGAGDNGRHGVGTSDLGPSGLRALLAQRDDVRSIGWVHELTPTSAKLDAFQSGNSGRPLFPAGQRSRRFACPSTPCLECVQSRPRCRPAPCQLNSQWPIASSMPGKSQGEKARSASTPESTSTLRFHP
jgi:hypothetical protein